MVELFECDDFNEARRLANLLDGRNRDRQKMQQQITELALLETEKLSETKFVVVSGEGWHRGVIGLAASRIAERVFRPTIVLSSENGVAHGSARSIPNFHLLQAMESCPELFEQFGGHVRRTRGDALSGGERRRVEIARCLATQPRFILLDEPFAGIDPLAIDDIREIILYLKKRGIGTLITDHNVRETLSITDRAYIMSEGRILKNGSPEALVNDDDVRRLYLGSRFEL